MQKHTRIYLKHIGMGDQDVIICEKCRAARATDVHHIQIKGMGGRKNADRIVNLIGLCRRCHSLAHDGTISQKVLEAIADRRIERIEAQSAKSGAF